ncbi:hypothetical protein M1145_00810 [Patescibacteria group bacterium]|nr:hypothetical protein [Patescibacteria group bacterium]
MISNEIDFSATPELIQDEDVLEYLKWLSNIHWDEQRGLVWKTQVNKYFKIGDDVCYILSSDSRYIELDKINDPKLIPSFYHLSDTGHTSTPLIFTGHTPTPLIMVQELPLYVWALYPQYDTRYAFTTPRNIMLSRIDIQHDPHIAYYANQKQIQEFKALIKKLMEE